jgi:hypothetical protein
METTNFSPEKDMIEFVKTELSDFTDGELIDELEKRRGPLMFLKEAIALTNSGK